MSGEKIPDIWLERFLLNELPPAEAEQVRAALASDPALAKSLAELRRTGAELLRRHPPAEMKRTVFERIQSSRGEKSSAVFSRLFFSPFGLGLVATILIAALGVGLFWRAELRRQTVVEEGLRGKGDDVRLLVFKKTAGGIEQLSDHSKVKRNDLIQLSYYSAGQEFGAILSIDGRGTITQHLPEQGTVAARLSKGRITPLQSAFRLDDAPAREVFFLVVSGEQFPVQLIKDAMVESNRSRSGYDGRLALPTGYEQASFVLEKDDRR